MWHHGLGSDSGAEETWAESGSMMVVQTMRLAKRLYGMEDNKGKNQELLLGICLEHLGEWPCLLLRCGILVKGCV